MPKGRMTSEERKKQILGVAMRLFSRRGFKGTTTKEIASVAGVSEATIFKHFPRKGDLYTAIIDECCNDREGHFILLKRVAGKEGRGLFKEIASFIMRGIEEDPAFMRLLMFSALEGHKLSEIFFKTRVMETIEYLAGCINEFARAGLFKKMDSRLAASAFMGMVIHYSMAQEIYGMKRYFKVPLQKVVDTFVEIFFKGMERREG